MDKKVNPTVFLANVGLKMDYNEDNLSYRWNMNSRTARHEMNNSRSVNKCKEQFIQHTADDRTILQKPSHVPCTSGREYEAEYVRISSTDRKQSLSMEVMAGH